MTSFISSCCAICVAFGVIVGDGGRPVSTMGCTVAVVVDVGDRAKVIVGVEIDASVAVKISIGDGDGIKGCCNTGVQEDKITTRITIVAVCNFICPTFSARERRAERLALPACGRGRGGSGAGKTRSDENA